MFDPTFPDDETLPPELSEVPFRAVRKHASATTAEPDVELLFPFPLAETEKSLVVHESLPPASKKVRLVFLLNPDEEAPFRLSTGKLLPHWLHELVGWGVFLALLGSCLALQIYFNRVLSNPLSQILIFLSVFAEIGLLWRWDQYWY